MVKCQNKPLSIGQLSAVTMNNVSRSVDHLLECMFCAYYFEIIVCYYEHLLHYQRTRLYRRVVLYYLGSSLQTTCVHLVITFILCCGSREFVNFLLSLKLFSACLSAGFTMSDSYEADAKMNILSQVIDTEDMNKITSNFTRLGGKWFLISFLLLL